MSHPAEPALVHPTTASVVDYHPHPPKRKKPLASDLLIAEKAKKPAIFTLENLKRDALAGSITGLLAVPAQPLNTIVAIQFVPLLAMVGVIAAFTYRRTNSYVPGALICAMVICWYVTAGTATHWSPEFRLPGAAASR